MDTCPFCGAVVRREIATMGGSCPRCLAQIPGEDAPTELGAPVQRVPVRRRPGWVGALAGLVAALGVMALGAVALLLAFTLRPRPVRMAERAPVVMPEVVGTLEAPREPEVAAVAAAPPPKPVPTPAPQPVAAPAPPAATARGAALNLSAGPSVATRQVALRSGPEIRQMIGTRVRASLPQLSHCYNRRLKLDAKAGGSYRLVFAVVPDGGVADVRVEPLGKPDAALQECLVRHVQTRWTFPPIAQRSVVSRVLTFAPPAPR